MITEKKKEEVDKGQRESNLFIYRAKESNKENSEERQNKDKQFFDALCNDILGIGPVKTKNIIRLGKKNDQDDEQKPPRPLKIVLEDTIYHNKILQKNCDNQKTYLRILAWVQIIAKMSGRKSEPWPQKQRKKRKSI